MQMESIAAKIAAYESLREQAEDLNEQLSELNARKDAAEAEVISAILDAQEQTGVEALGEHVAAARALLGDETARKAELDRQVTGGWLVTRSFGK